MLAKCSVVSPFSSPYGFRISSLSMLLLRSATTLPLLLLPPPGGGFLLPLFCASSRGAGKSSILGAPDVVGENPICRLGSPESDFLQAAQWHHWHAVVTGTQAGRQCSCHVIPLALNL